MRDNGRRRGPAQRTLIYKEMDEWDTHHDVSNALAAGLQGNHQSSDLKRIRFFGGVDV